MDSRWNANSLSFDIARLDGYFLGFSFEITRARNNLPENMMDWTGLQLLAFTQHNQSNGNSGYLGASGCMILSSWGSAWGTWRAGLGVCHMGIDHPKGIIKNIVPIVMAGVLGIYGLIVSVIITQAISTPGGDGSNTYSIYNGYTHVRLLDFS